MSSTSLRKAIHTLSRLPGLGPRSAQRAVLYALKGEGAFLDQLISDLVALKNCVKKCNVCGNLDDTELCSICQNAQRDTHRLCLVENVSDLWAVERTRVFEGRYHILGGVLSAIDGIGPQQLNMQKLLERIEKEKIEEVVIALSATVEGQTTTFYLVDMLSHLNVRVFSLSQGIPVGGELNYLDDGTLSAAFLDRRELSLSKVSSVSSERVSEFSSDPVHSGPVQSDHDYPERVQVA